MNISVTLTFNVKNENSRNKFAVNYSIVDSDGTVNGARLEGASINEAVQEAADEIECMIGAAVRRQRRVQASAS